MRFRGSFVPLITPFDKKGRLDKKTLEALIEWHISQKTDGVICCATTGEGPSLSEKERKIIAEVSVEAAAGRIPILISTGVSDTKTSVRYTEIAQKIGAAGSLVVTPYYNKPSQRGCILHFKEIAKVGLPLIVYHNPPRAVVRLSVETILELSQVPHIVAIKESSHDLPLVAKISKHIDVFAGDDDISVPILKEGGVGTISAVANLIPHGWKKMVSLCLEKRWDEAEVMAARYLPLIRSIFLETNPQGPKFALSWLGRCELMLRLPMIPPTLATQLAIKRALFSLALPQFRKIQTAST